MVEFSASFFIGNRERLSTALPNSLIVITAHSLLQESADISFPFRQDSNFYYLTGIDEPDLVLVINSKLGDSILLLPEQNDYQKEWEGANNSAEFLTSSGIKKSESLKKLPYILKLAKQKGLQICYLQPLEEKIQPYGFYTNPARAKLAAVVKRVEPEPVDIRTHLAKLRQVKQPQETKSIQEAIDITGKTLNEVKKQLKNFKTEKELERAITAGFFRNGSDGHGYEPIVASGSSAATIHYSAKEQKTIGAGLLLLDVGAKVNRYAADISRTWAVGRVSKRQREVFDVVYSLQQQAFSLLKPGIIIREYQKIMEENTVKALKGIGLDNHGPYPHGFSHFLGLDIHDAGEYDAPLVENSVLTVEPGIYLPDEGIGVRIEDDVLITKTGIRNMSKNIPSELI